MADFYVFTDNVSVGYNGKPLIEHIKIGVTRGEILTLIGPNGSGKSTILKSIIGQLKLISGTVIIEGCNMQKLSARGIAKKLSIVMTERLRPELMSCREIVETGRYPYTGMLGILSDDDKKKVQSAIELVKAEDFAERPFSEISDGQRQRILLARAICQEPEVIVLDEPTSFLDIKHKIELLSILKMLVREKNIAVIMSLHEIDLAEKVSDCAVCVKDGQILLCDTPEKVFRDGFIKELYDIETGSYNTLFGCIEMQKALGEPRVFVIGGGGSGIPVYRFLQRKNVPFAAGVLLRNDIDFPVADALASIVISEAAYTSISDVSIENAMQIMKKCEAVICTLSEFPAQIKPLEKLYGYAGDEGLLTDTDGLLRRLEAEE